MALVEDVYRFSTEEYDRMVDAGVLEGMRVEFLDGLLVDVTPQGERHAWVIGALQDMLGGTGGRLRIQLPLAVAEGWTPEPDAAVVPGPGSWTEHPTTAAFVAEVAVTSQRHDRRKARVYAAAGVPVYWLVDVAEDRVVAHSEPTSSGYSVSEILTGDDVLDCCLPGAETITVADLLPWTKP